MTCASTRASGATVPGALRALPVLLIGVVLGGCDLLDVTAPDRVREAVVESPANAELLVTSAVADFDCALASYIVTTGQVHHEFINSNIYSAEAFDYDRRTVNPARQQYATFECGGFGAIYQPVSTAIWQADQALTRLDAWTDEEVENRTELIGKAATYAGYGRLLLGEAFCTAAIDQSPEITPEDVFQQAEQLFTRAIQQATAAGATDILNTARVGRARARVNLGNGADAMTDAQQVPANFVYYAHYSDQTNRSANFVHNRNNRLEGVSVGPSYRNVTYQGVADPRVPVMDMGKLAVDGLTPVWHQMKYTSRNDPIPVASGDEARLIIAEVEGGATAVGIINDFHQAAGLPPFNSTDEADIQAHVIQERARELFLEGQRFWDFRRFELPFEPPVGAPYSKGGEYGDMRCFPLPDVERDNNPNMAG